MVAAMEPRAFYVADGDRLIPTDATRGPWDPGLQHGGPPTAAIARACERHLGDPEWAMVRFTFELLRPVPLQPVAIAVSEGAATRRLRRLEVVMEAEGKVVVRALAVACRRAPVELPALPAEAALPDPEGCPPLAAPVMHGSFGYARALTIRAVRGVYGAGPVAAWLRPEIDLVEGEASSPTVRALIVADSCNGLSPVVDPRRFWFMSADLTVHLHRPPAGAWIGLDAATTLEGSGVGLARGRLHDVTGPFGHVSQDLIVGPRG